MIKFRGIKQKFVITVTVLLFVTSVFISFFFPYQQQQGEIANLLDNTRSLGRVLAYTCVSAMVFMDLESVQNRIESVRELDEVDFVLVSDPFGDEILTAFQQEKSRPFEKDISELLARHEGEETLYENLETEILMVVPIVQRSELSGGQAEVLGKLIFGVNKGKVLDSISQSRMTAVFVSFLILIIGGGVFDYQAGRIVKPLVKLERVTRTVASGDYSSAVAIDANDEVGRLSNSFNVMVKSIKSSLEQLEERNHTIEEINKQIIDSIYYSQVIQKAILPMPAQLDTPHYEASVIYKPKDIVSGDFYWTRKKDNKYFWCVVDCTGHGVPGAFMTLIGSTFLDQVISKHHKSEASVILDNLNKAIRSFLQQDTDSSELRDGMDMILVVLDVEKQEMQYAGARRSLYMISAEGNKFTEIKGTRKSVGGKTSRKIRQFTTEYIPLEAGMQVYLTSDGYADQMDNSGRKFGTKQLKERIQLYAKKSINEQRDFLLNDLDAHQENEEQLDDITMVALKIKPFDKG